MKFFLLIFFLLSYKSSCRRQGPPDDPSQVNPYMHYYDVYINETTKFLDFIEPQVDNIPALYITGQLQVTHRELDAFFKNIIIIWNGIRIDNTNLHNISFLKPDHVHTLDGSSNSIEITNNANMTKLGFDFRKCTYCVDSIKITNNSQLIMGDECEAVEDRYGSKRKIYDNLEDCGCQIKGDFMKFIQTMPKTCSFLIGDIKLNETSDFKVLMEKMKDVTMINGALEITNTEFPNLSFLKSVQWIKSSWNMDSRVAFASVVITNNSKLETLQINAKLDGLNLRIVNNPKLCVLGQELDGLFYGEILSSTLDFKVCFNKKTPKTWCNISNGLENLPNNCRNISGNLLLGADLNYEHLEKLYGVNSIFGSLKIINSTLRSTHMLYSLTKVRTVQNGTHPIVIANNTWLTRIMTDIVLENVFDFIVENNPGIGFISKDQCTEEYWDKFNRHRCGFVSPNTTSKFDSTPLNIDFFHELPRFSDVFHENPNDDVTEDPSVGESTSEIPITSTSPTTTLAPENLSSALLSIWNILLLTFVFWFSKNRI